MRHIKQEGGHTIDQKGYFSIGQFARQAGVSVRTIRYYDKIGLLHPSAYTASGRRLYSEADMLHLEQILTLKLIGLSLEEIKNLRDSNSRQIEVILEAQKRAIREKIKGLSQVVQTIEQAQRMIQASGQLDLTILIEIIKVVNMNMQKDWLGQFFTGDQQASFAQISTSQTLDEQKQTGQAWQGLFNDIQDQLNTDPRNPAVRHLVERWDELIGTIALDDPDFMENLTSAYLHLDQLDVPQAVKAWLADIQSAAEFIRSARLNDDSE